MKLFATMFLAFYKRLKIKVQPEGYIFIKFFAKIERQKKFSLVKKQAFSENYIRPEDRSATSDSFVMILVW